MPTNRIFDTSCFNGTYVTGDINKAYFDKVRPPGSVRSNLNLIPGLFLRRLLRRLRPRGMTQRNFSATLSSRAACKSCLEARASSRTMETTAL